MAIAWDVDGLGLEWRLEQNISSFIMETMPMWRGCASKGGKCKIYIVKSKNGPEAQCLNVMAAGSGEYSGVVKSYNAQKGWGLIECADTFAQYGKDMFVWKTSIAQPCREGGSTLHADKQNTV